MALKRKVKVLADDDGISISAAYEEFIADKEVSGCAPATIIGYNKSFNFFAYSELDDELDTDVNEITKVHIQQWIASMKSNKKRITTINHYVRDIRAFLYWCMSEDREYIKKPYKIELVKGQETLPKVFSDEEVEILMQKPTYSRDFAEWRTWAIVNWVLGTGNRAQTICNVKIGDIDFNNNEIALRHTKSKKMQVIPLAHSLKNIITTYIKKCRRGAKANDWLFPRIDGQQLTVNALSHAFAKYCKDRDVEHTNIHGLRHYFATSWVRGGGSGDKLQMALGHSTYDMTKRYISLVDADLKDGFDKYNPLDNLKMGSRRKRTVAVEED